MAAKVKAVVKLQLPAGKATPAPPVGTALGPHGINIPQFVKDYNARTAANVGMTIPVEITIMTDRSFTFVLKTPPAPALLKQAANVQKGAAKPKSEKSGKVTRAQIAEIAKAKMPDLNAVDLEGAVKMIEGTARSMGLEVVD